MSTVPSYLLKTVVIVAALLVQSGVLQAQSITFEDVSEQAGVLTDVGVHGIAVADYNNDGWDDIFLGADGNGSTLLINQQNGEFVDATESSGLLIYRHCVESLMG